MESRVCVLDRNRKLALKLVSGSFETPDIAAATDAPSEDVLRQRLEEQGFVVVEVTKVVGKSTGCSLAPVLVAAIVAILAFAH